MLQRSVLKKAYILSSRQLSNRRERILRIQFFGPRGVSSRAKLSNNHEPSGDAQLSAVATLVGTAAFPDKIQATQTVAMKPISLPELATEGRRRISRLRSFLASVQTEVRTSGATIPVFHKGDGPPVLLLHGYPETHVTWHKVAPRLAERFSVYLPDLRGYGDSSRSADGDRHLNYSFRAMALDQVETDASFWARAVPCGCHDRGARVAHRLCLDSPKSVKKVCLMDIAPTLTMYRQPIKSCDEVHVVVLLIQAALCLNISLDSILSTIWEISLAD